MAWGIWAIIEGLLDSKLSAKKVSIVLNISQAASGNLRLLFDTFEIKAVAVIRVRN